MTRISAGLSTLAGAGESAAEAARATSAALAGADADLAFLFLSADHLEDVPTAVAEVRAELAPRHLLGCVAQGVIGRERELEEGPATVVWAASLPGAAIETFHLEPAEATDDSTPAGLAGADLVFLLADPFTFSVTELLSRANETSPGVPIVGGIATGGGQPGMQALVVDSDVYDGGAVGATLAGVAVETVVSQGCAPLGREAVITSAETNVVLELAGQPALTRLRATLGGLSAREQALASRGLLAGLVIDENRPEYGRGDYLMRSIVGADEDTGALAIGDVVRVGQTLRFHARDADSADEDLRLALSDALERAPAPAVGALLFTCNGRGAGMFGRPDHDSAAVAAAVGPSVAGFFCGGEIGPVGGENFVHGFTATMALFLEET